VVAEACLIRAGMVVQLATVKQERNTAILKVIEKEDAIRHSSEQLQSESCSLVLFSSSLY
jgi:hypothetical protein